ncbi:MAG: ATP-binding protein [Prevotella sp.]|nr:ATP-binding protein [Prevotella sp.]
MEKLFDVIDKLDIPEPQVNRKEGDYIDPKDGCWHCGKCGKPLEIYVSQLHSKHRCLCRCAEEKLIKSDNDIKLDKRQHQIQYLKDQGNYARCFSNATFKGIETNNENLPQKQCKNYVQHFEEMKENDQGLLLQGNIGTGKTYLAYSIANDLMDLNYRVFILNCCCVCHNDFIDDNRNFSHIAVADLFILDDLGAQRDTNYGNSIIHDIVDTRCNTGKPMIVTTNLTVEDMYNETDITKQRMYDRILGCCLPIQVAGESLRQKVANQRNSVSAKILMSD